MRYAALWLSLLLTCCTCAHHRPPEKVVQVAQTSTLHLMEPVVLVVLVLDEVVVTSGETRQSVRAGTGVAYSTPYGGTTRFLTAWHVLETPAVGSIRVAQDEDLGVSETRVVVATRLMAKGVDGECEAVILARGVSGTGDVATAQCKKGVIAPPAQFAKEVPIKGEQVFIVGHPGGSPLPVVSTGWYGGEAAGYMLSSAPATGGNSGGPLYYNGRVVGIVVRYRPDSLSMSLAVGPAEISRRLRESGDSL